jgi:REP element-mobilizing transposase RayT
MSSNKLSSSRRKSYIEIGEIYFWTATINNWIHLLAENSYKKIILDSLTNLSNRGLVDIFAFAIMPNHIHLIWRINNLNGKETVQASFLKYTAHQFKRMLQIHPKELLKFAVNARNKKYEFWQRDALAIELYSKAVMLQKLHYIHMNPLAPHWQLANDPNNYYWSSARFYEQGVNEFVFLKSVWTVFD